MEQKVIERINNAIDVYNEKVRKFNANAKQLLDELFTDDIKMMVEDICKSRNVFDNKRIEFRFDDAASFYITNGRDIVHPFDGSLHLNEIEKESSYSDGVFSFIDCRIYDYERSVKALQSIQSHADEVIDKIVSMYEEKVNYQMNELDKILQRLGDGEIGTKHIKVTVEWI